jgi:hypothetical protein
MKINRGYAMLVLSMVALALCSFQAAAELFDGKFTGTVIGDQDTSAPLTLNLAQTGNSVTGTATVGDGLGVDLGGFICPGLVAVPSGTIDVSGNVSPDSPNQLVAASSISASGFNINAEVLADLAENGNSMEIQLKLKIPSPCKSATLRANLSRSE